MRKTMEVGFLFSRVPKNIPAFVGIHEGSGLDGNQCVVKC